MPPFDSIELSGHIPIRGKQRGYIVEQARLCIQNPDHIEKTQGRGINSNSVNSSIGAPSLVI
jgi:hypothetical protein